VAGGFFCPLPMNHKKNTLLAIVCLGLFISSPAQKLSNQQIHDLTLLGQVWGFLKYYHPSVAKGNFDWDQQLFRKIPLVKNAKNNSELNSVFLNWIDSLGTVDACRKCDQVSDDLITYNLDERWMSDNRFSAALQQKIVYIKNNRHQGPGYYVKYGGAGQADIIHEREYDSPEMVYPNEALRLLFLFRYWNTINYFFPYKNVIGKDWSVSLHEFVPLFAEAADTLQYQAALATLLHSINDTHSMTRNEVLQEEYGKFFLPVRLKIINDEAVVTGYYDEELGEKSGLVRGDVIEKIGDKTIKQLIDERAPLVNGSNYPSKLAALQSFNFICGGKDRIVDLTVRTQKGRSVIKANRHYFSAFSIKGRLTPDSIWKILPGNIGYVHMGMLEVKYVDSVMQQLKDCAGIIFDIRNYPRGTMFKIALYLLNSQQKFARIAFPNLDYPGTYAWKNYIGMVGPLRPDDDIPHYKGKVVLLVNESTISHAEWTTMALQTVPGSVTIGSQTAGADGNVSRIIWPGNVNHAMTGLGIFYPDGSPTQRVGVKVDIEVRPTVEGIREDRDEVLERAIKYIQDKR
jgi:carboxyl-terminal processing protease